MAIADDGRDGGRQYIDKSGRYIMSLPGVYAHRTFTEGLGVVIVHHPDGSSKCGYVDTTGRLVVQPKYDYACPFSEGLALVRISVNDFFIDKKGQVVLDPPYHMMSSFSEGLAIMQMNSLLAYVDKSGRIAIPTRFKCARDFREGLVAVSLDGERWGYINKRGQFVVELQFARAREFHEGLACVGVKVK